MMRCDPNISMVDNNNLHMKQENDSEIKFLWYKNIGKFDDA